VSRRFNAMIGVLVLGAVAGGSTAIFFAVRSSWRRTVLDTPVQRGRMLAERMGCFGCHGAGGAQPIPNAGAKGGEVPGWPGGTWMMWNRDEADVRSWILVGHPRDREGDPGALIKMPAYGKRLSDKETDDLVAYVLAASHFGPIDDERASAGHEIAYRLGCFGCHGPEGRGLVMNPGSFKGYVPPWDGPDFADLVRDDDEFRQWVLAGACNRLRANPIARRLLDSQAISMPAYRGRISEDDLRAVAAYVAWVRAHPRTGVQRTPAS
jgi:mono/diheme cytochrome c family protein